MGPGGSCPPRKIGEQITSLIDDVASQDISAAEKARLLLEGASKIKGANFFPRNPPMVGAERVFVGARASGGYNAGQSPVVIVQQNGDVLRGWTQNNPFTGEPGTIIREALKKVN